jgi:deoxyribodipyrimidine photo-lyase
MSTLAPTRAAALARLAEFVPAMGSAYSSGRNYDHGPGRHSAVSGLSPHIRRRLITEKEVVTAAVSAHGPDGAGKFIDEVFWRGYFKGWLERRPQVWDLYQHGLRADLTALERDATLRQRVAQAEAGESGLACFDAWARELVETGYLHNHARMWFASIWIFTFGLPWRLGADFFLRHLLDGDAASNTLGWRWVAGLHTRGKPYQAQAWNIARFTAGRFTPKDSDLASVCEGLEATEPDGLPPVLPLRALAPPRTDLPSALLITEEDCCIEGFDLSNLSIRCAATLAASALRSPLPVAPAVVGFEAAALADAAARAGVPAAPLKTQSPQILASWAAGAGVRQIVTPYIPTGPLRDWIDKATPALAAQGITLAHLRRDWDTAIWPHTTAGFFKLKQQIPRILRDLSVP